MAVDPSVAADALRARARALAGALASLPPSLVSPLEALHRAGDRASWAPPGWVVVAATARGEPCLALGKPGDGEPIFVRATAHGWLLACARAWQAHGRALAVTSPEAGR